LFRLIFALAFAVVCWRAGGGVYAPLAVYRRTKDRSALAIACAWSALACASGIISIWILLTTRMGN